LAPREMKLKPQELVAAMTLVNAEVKRVREAVLKQDILLFKVRKELRQLKDGTMESPYYWEHYQGN